MPDIVPPHATQPIIDKEGKMEQVFRTWTQDITRLDLIIGTGSPEGVIDAEQGREYMDRSGTASALKYIKRDSNIGGDSTQGWILI